MHCVWTEWQREGKRGKDDEKLFLDHLPSLDLLLDTYAKPQLKLLQKVLGEKGGKNKLYIIYIKESQMTSQN